MTVTPATRIFAYRGLTLPDPDCRLSPDEVKAAFSTRNLRPPRSAVPR